MSKKPVPIGQPVFYPEPSDTPSDNLVNGSAHSRQAGRGTFSPWRRQRGRVYIQQTLG